ncbi:MAG TPA: hypothetical protein VF970_10685 [Gemmatimonadales bacterium]
MAKSHKPVALAKRGPTPEVLTVEGDWQDAVKEAVTKPRPPEGWPDRPVKPRKKRHRKTGSGKKRKPL